MKLSRSCLLLALVIALHLAFTLAHQPPAIVTPDAHGYWVQGRLIAETGDGSKRLERSLEYTHPLWLYQPDGRFVSKYPPGLPLFVALVRSSLGHAASIRINPILAAIGLLAAALAAARIYGAPWAPVLALILALSPVYTQQALWCFSHSAVFALFSSAFLLTLIWNQQAEAGRSSRSLLVGVGLLLGAIPTVHYPELLLGLGLFAWMLRQHYRRSPSILSLFKDFTPLIGAGMIPILALAWRNALVFGAPWRTGYASTGEQAGFSLAAFLRNFPGYTGALVIVGLGLLTPLAVAGGIVGWRSKHQRPLIELYIFVSLPLLLLYSAYYWPASPLMVPTLRFLHPLLLPLGLAALAPLVTLKRRGLGAGWKRAVWIAVLIVQGLWSLGALTAAIFEARHLAAQKRVLVQVTELLKRAAPEGSIILGPEFAHQHLDLIGSWRLANMDLLNGPPPGARNRPEGADAPQAMQRAAIKARLGPLAELSPRARIERFRAELADWADQSGSQVFVIAGPSQLNEDFILRLDELERLASLTLPELGPPRRPDRPSERARGRSGGAQREFGPQGRGPPGPPGPGEAFSGTELRLLRWIRPHPETGR